MILLLKLGLSSCIANRPASMLQSLGYPADLVMVDNLRSIIARFIVKHLPGPRSLVVARLTELEVVALRAVDPLAPLPPSRWRRLTGYGVVLFALAALWLADLFTNLVTELLADGLRVSLPSGLGGLILLAVGGLGLALLGALLQRREEP